MRGRGPGPILRQARLKFLPLADERVRGVGIFSEDNGAGDFEIARDGLLQRETSIARRRL